MMMNDSGQSSTFCVGRFSLFSILHLLWITCECLRELSHNTLSFIYFFFNFGVDKENASEYLSPLSLRTNGQHPNRQCVVYDL